jgi:outer membrane receptor protein involved in Fe transport
MLHHARTVVICGLAWLALAGAVPSAFAAGGRLGGTSAGAQTGAVSGSVIDVSGAPIPNALIAVTAKDGSTSELRADANGHFVLPASSVRIFVTSTGLEPVEMAVPPDGGPMHVVMRPANFADTIVVTATRSEERLPTAASATVVTAAELNNMAAGALDDALRYTPGFTLFRRSSSRVANPTTQGVTLRGVSGSGASRTLVLADGVPLNDPFGSWVYWNRIPQAAVDRVEVVRGATGDLYGAGALGGVVQVLTVQPDRTRVRATLDGGSRGTVRGSLFAAAERNGWAGLGAYEGVETDGAYIVAPEVRGTVDVRADSDYQTGFFGAGRRTSEWHAWVRGAAYAEDRGNGTPVTVNSTDWSQVSVNAGGIVGRGALQLQFAGNSQDYYQTFSAVAANRLSERLTTKQTTDTTHRLFNGQWTRGFARMTIVAGGEFHKTDSTVTEFRYSVTNVESGPFPAGGTETLRALFARATVMATDSLSFEVGGRGDWWKSEPTDTTLAVKSVDFFSPRASVSWRQGRYSVQGAVYRASRTPSLNELHRGFRAGNVVTNPNPLLNPETLTGAEGGVLMSSRKVSLRATAFFNSLKGAIANITLTQTPAQITRQRQNSDKIRARGLEVEADARLTPALSVNAQLVFTSSHFLGSVAAPAVEGNTVTQVPSVQGGFTVTWADPRWLTAALQMRASGRQFDDDLNTPAFILKKYAVWDAQVSRAVVRGVTAFLALENITDSEFDVARTPVRNIGWPRTARAGVRVAWQ